MRIIHCTLFFVVVSSSACLDMPINKLDKTAGPIVDSDASTDGGMTPQERCFACMEAPEDPGPGCQTVYAACRENSKCSAIIDCGIAHLCFQGARREFLNCGLPCVANAGVLTPDDPVLVLASTLFQCFTNGACGDSCFSSD